KFSRCRENRSNQSLCRESHIASEAMRQQEGRFMRQGKCEMCHLMRDLHDSHFLPKAGYKGARENSLKNPNPIMLSGGKAKHSSLQVRDYKFCTACEKRLNEGGESWVLKVIPNTYDGRFKVHEMIEHAIPVYARKGLVILDGANIPNLEMHKLIYFAI